MCVVAEQSPPPVEPLASSATASIACAIGPGLCPPACVVKLRQPHAKQQRRLPHPWAAAVAPRPYPCMCPSISSHCLLSASSKVAILSCPAGTGLTQGHGTRLSGRDGRATSVSLTPKGFNAMRPATSLTQAPGTASESAPRAVSYNIIKNQFAPVLQDQTNRQEIHRANH